MTQRALLDGELIIGFCGDDVDPESHPTIPDGVPIERLRFVGGELIVLADEPATYHVDRFGRLHVAPGDGLQPIVCAWTDRLVRAGGIWRIRTEADVLEELKRDLKARVDQEAEAVRLLYITAGDGQSMTYSEKAAEVERLSADPAPDPANYPMLSASLGIEGDTLQEIAALVIATRGAWLATAAAIERLRLGAKASIAAASTPAEASAAAAVEWPTVSA